VRRDQNSSRRYTWWIISAQGNLFCVSRNHTNNKSSCPTFNRKYKATDDINFVFSIFLSLFLLLRNLPIKVILSSVRKTRNIINIEHFILQFCILITNTHNKTFRSEDTATVRLILSQKAYQRAPWWLGRIQTSILISTCAKFKNKSSFSNNYFVGLNYCSNGDCTTISLHRDLSRLSFGSNFLDTNKWIISLHNHIL